MLSERQRAGLEVHQLLEVSAQYHLAKTLCPRSQPSGRSKTLLASEPTTSFAERKLALRGLGGGERVQRSQLAVAVEHRVVEAGCGVPNAAGRRAADEVRQFPAPAHPQEQRRELHGGQVWRRQGRKLRELAQENRGALGRFVAALFDIVVASQDRSVVVASVGHA